jgi:hypothetical protein
MANIQKNIELKIDTTQLDRLCIGGRIYDALTWKTVDDGKCNLNSILGYDHSTKEILIKERDLLKLIQLATPHQPDRRIRLISE